MAWFMHIILKNIHLKFTTMKHLFLSTLVLLFVGSTAFAQIETTPQMSSDVGTAPIQKGNWMVGGGIGSLGYDFDSEVFNISLEPGAGYFVSDGIAIGLKLIANYQTIKEGDNPFSYGLLPFARYYFPEGASASNRFFAEAKAGIAGSRGGDDVNFGFGAGLGYSHFITRTVALEALAGYNDLSGASASGTQGGLGLMVGFQIYLPGRR